MMGGEGIDTRLGILSDCYQSKQSDAVLSGNNNLFIEWIFVVVGFWGSNHVTAYLDRRCKRCVVRMQLERCNLHKEPYVERSLVGLIKIIIDLCGFYVDFYV